MTKVQTDNCLNQINAYEARVNWKILYNFAWSPLYCCVELRNATYMFSSQENTASIAILKLHCKRVMAADWNGESEIKLNTIKWDSPELTVEPPANVHINLFIW